ncbi:MAG: hypothetical protein ABW203_05355 [Novosphingobium sp.]
MLIWFAPMAFGSVALADPPAPKPGWTGVVEGFREPRQQQVRVEQRVVIRIAPRAASREVLAALPQVQPPRYRERKIGKCLPLSGIAGVRIGNDDRLLLYMRDRRLIGANLEKACRARDFYSGFYVERSGDGQICVDRDMLLSRSGASCSVSRLRQLDTVEKDK